MPSSLPVYNLTLIEGADYALSLTLTENNIPIDITDYTFESAIKENYGDGALALASFTITIPNPATGEVILSLDDAITQDLFATDDPTRARAHVGYWDVFFTPSGGARQYLLGGRVTYIQTITPRIAV